MKKRQFHHQSTSKEQILLLQEIFHVLKNVLEEDDENEKTKYMHLLEERIQSN